jgi:hypothetical protein
MQFQFAGSRTRLLGIAGIATAATMLATGSPYPAAASVGRPTGMVVRTVAGAPAPVESLYKIMHPRGLRPVGTHCIKAVRFGLRALKHSTFCGKTSARKVVVWGYQFDSKAAYLAGFKHINSFTGFTPSSAGPTCPASKGREGSVGWHANSNPRYKPRPGQILECFIDNKRPLLIWTMPTQHVFFIGQDQAHGSTERTLVNWWKTLNYSR